MLTLQSAQTEQLLRQQLEQRILVLDGAMGTMVQALELDEASVRGERFADHPRDLSRLVDILCLTHPDEVTQIHREYLEAGADIVETKTFGASAIGMAEFDLPAELGREINFAAVQCARQAVDEFNERTPDKPRFVAGSIGPRPADGHIDGRGRCQHGGDVRPVVQPYGGRSRPGRSGR
jgi:5-methyltetrahydrofolate--homocysteine methyltransferase